MADPAAEYWEKFIYMPEEGWSSSPNAVFDLGWVDGLFKVANKSIDQFFGGYDWQLDEDDPLDLSDLENFADKGKGAIIYASIWIAAVAIFTIAGIIWCLCNKCICCCRSSFKGRGDSEMDRLENTDPHFELRPRYSERKGKNIGKPSSGAIVVSVLMGIWLLSLILMILLTFGANEKTREAINEVQPDLDNALVDVLEYLNITIRQLSYTFGDSYQVFDRKVKVDTLQRCRNDDQRVCDTLSDRVINQMDGGGSDGVDDDLLKDLEELIKALNDVSTEARSAKTELDDNIEDILTDVNNGLYWLFMLFNLLYLAVFALVLLGTVLAVFAKQSGLKTAGYLMMRVAIVLIFVMGIFIVAQLVLMFIVGGLITVVCPAVRGLENEPTAISSRELHPLSGGEGFQVGGGYEIPSIGQIIRSCKAGNSAYNTFDLSKAFDLEGLDAINNRFKDIFPPGGIVGTGLNNRSNSHIKQNGDLSPVETAVKVQTEVSIYTTFIKNAVRAGVGKCQPTYNALNSTINLFCHKVTAPLVSFWWILQFIAAVFVLITITAMVFERFHF